MNSPRFIATKLDIDIATGEVLSREGYWYDGPVAECKGAGPAQEQQQRDQAAFATTLASDYEKQFGTSSAITNSLHATLAPIIQAGPNQYGFSNAQDAVLRTQASAGTSTAFRNAKQSLGDTQASQGGGDEFLPSGVKDQQQQDLAVAAANKESSDQLAITGSGYDTGRKQFDTAVGQDEGLVSLLNPSGYAGATTNASGLASSSAATNKQMDDAGSPWGTIGGILAGAASAASKAAVAGAFKSGGASSQTSSGTSSGTSFGSFSPTSD